MGAAAWALGLLSLLTSWVTFDRNNPLNLFQEIVDRDWIEYTVDLYSAEGRLMSCVPRQRLEARGGEIVRVLLVEMVCGALSAIILNFWG